jgi:predicted TIM-barrel fold metal-dependent hydrolase
VIIDCHTHLNNYHEQVKHTLSDSVTKLRTAMAEARIDYALVLTSYIVNPDRPSVREVIDAIGEAKDLGVVAGISYLHYKERDLRELADDLRAGRVKGLKLYPGYEPFYPHDKRLKVVYDLAEEFQVPVMIHTGDTYSPKGKLKYAHPLEIDEVAVDHPNVKFVICHLGNPWLTDAMEVVYKNANVYADISGLMLGEFSQAFEDYMSDEIEDVITYAGEPEKFLFGTDWPICSMKSYLEFVERLEISAKDKHLLLYGNSRRLFRLDLPPAPEPAGG